MTNKVMIKIWVSGCFKSYCQFFDLTCGHAIKLAGRLVLVNTQSIEFIFNFTFDIQVE